MSINTTSPTTTRAQTNDMATQTTQDYHLWMERIRTLAQRLGCGPSIRSALAGLQDLDSETINLGIVGAPNAGKSTLINSLLKRQLLPVTPLPSLLSWTIEPLPEEAEESCAWSENSRAPLPQLSGLLQANQGRPAHYRLFIRHAWMGQRHFLLVEKPALDGLETDREAIVAERLREVDLLVLVIDALMPIKRMEAFLLAECARRNVPTVVVLSKLDKIPLEERQELIAYVRKHVEAYSMPIKLVLSASPENGYDYVGTLTSALEATAQQMDLAGLRRLQMGYALLEQLATLRSAAEAVLELEQKNASEKEAELQKRRQQLEGQQLAGLQIEQALSKKRQQIDQHLREHLQQNRGSILETLCYDLERSHDVKAWWTRDLPFRLQRELRSVASQLTAVINGQIASDLKWLQAELLKQYQYPVQLLAETRIALSPGEWEQKTLSLSDSHKFKIISRVGTAATVIMAGTLLATSGLAGAALAVSVLAGLSAEQIAHHNTSKDRARVRGELGRLVERAEHEYAMEVSAKLKAGYDEMLAHLKQHQSRWQEAQLEALTNMKNNGSGETACPGEEIMQQLSSLANEIKRETGI